MHVSWVFNYYMKTIIHQNILIFTNQIVKLSL